MPESSKFRPELLIPVGAPEKLLTAIKYGADAVYLGGQKYGLRYASDNFNLQDLIWARKVCSEENVKLFVVINSYFHQSDFKQFEDFIIFLNKLSVDALIVSDLGVIDALEKISNIPIHLSTQASCLNIEAAKFWKKQGVKRIVLGREVSIEDAAKIKREVDIEIEMFIHGSMCIAYSGQCTISNYTQGRDSNRGGCAHSCRFNYKLNYEKQELNNYFMSSKDLSGIQHLPKFFEHKIDSLKIEGRMKTAHYVGTVAKTYKKGINYLLKNGTSDWNEQVLGHQKELAKIGHRDYFDANLLEEIKTSSTFQERESQKNNYQVIGEVAEIQTGKEILIHCSHKFYDQDQLEILSFSSENIKTNIKSLKDILGKSINSTRPGQVVRIPYVENVKVSNLVRRIVL